MPMRAGLSNKVVGQTGEFAVCAELGKRGMIACPFAGNVPGFDVLAVDEHLNCIPIQVKTSKGRTWITGDLLNYVTVERNGKQMILGQATKPHFPNLIRVYVSLGQPGERNRYFVLTESDFYKVAVDSFREWFEKHGGIRPRNPDSRHTAVDISILEPFEDKWDLVMSQLAALQKSIVADQGSLSE
jgi:hypothetical protein